MRMMTRFAATFISTSMACIGPVHAGYLDQTFFALFEESDLQITYDGPNTISGGERWENVEFHNPAEGFRVVFDWIEEKGSPSDAVITFSDRMQIGEATDPQDITLNNLVWTVKTRNSGETHKVALDGATAFGDLPDSDGSFTVSLGEVASSIEWTQGDMVSITSSSQVATASVFLRDMENAGDALVIEFTGIQADQDGEISAELYEMMKAGEEPEPVTFMNIFRPNIASDTKVEKVNFTGRIEEGPDGPGTFAASLSDISAQYGVDTNDENLGLGGAWQIGKIDGRVDFEPAVVNTKIDGALVDIGLNLDRDWMETMINDGTAAMVDPTLTMTGMGLEYEIRLGQVEADGRVETPEGTVTFDASAEPSWETISFKDGAFDMEVDGGPFDLRAVVPMFSADEVSVTSDGAYAKFLMPMVPGEGLEEFVFKLVLRNYAASEQIWALFDPQALIPRDPFNTNIDIVALADILAPLGGQPDAAEAVDLEGIKINEFSVDGGGVEIFGSGEADFDLSTGIPVGDGTFDFDIKGLTGLMGKLAQLGVAPPAAVAGVNAGLGMFTKFEGPDHFSTKIEFFPDGTAKANGVDIPLPK